MVRGLIDDLYDVLFNYRRGLERVAQERSIWHGLVIYVAVTLIVSLATINLNAAEADVAVLVPPELAPLFPPDAVNLFVRIAPVFTLLFQLVFGPLYFLLMVAVLNLASNLLGGRGGVASLGAVLGYAYLPYLLVAVGGLLFRATDLNVVALLTFAALIWSLWLRIAGIKIVQNFSWGRAALTYFLPIIAVAVAILVFLLLSIIFIIPMLMQLVDQLSGGFPFT